MCSRTTGGALVVALVTASLHGQAVAQTAAEIDFVTREAAEPAIAARIPSFCEGIYVQPEAFAGAISPEFDAAMDITADSAEIIQNATTTLVGDVIVDQGSRLLQGSVVTLDDVTQAFSVEGPMLLREPGLLITGDSATGNMSDSTGTILDASFIFHQGRMRGSAAQLDKLANDHVILQGGRLTRCDPGDNTWQVRGRKIRLEPDSGWGVARDVTLNVARLPVFYMPYLRFPIDDERHSGFLYPSFGYDSLGGTDLIIPYYLNLAPNYDLTYAFRSLWKRGVIHETEGRWMTNNTSNLVNGAYLYKDAIYDSRREIDLTPGAENPAFEAQDRWMLHASHNGRWGKLRTTGRYSAVSDIDYLTDIGGFIDSGAHDNAVAAVQENLGDTARIPALRSWAEATWVSGAWRSGLLAEGFQPMDANQFEQYERLPEYYLRYRDQGARLRTSAELRYTFFERKNEGLAGQAATRGDRTFLNATVEAPMQQTWGYLIPAVNILHRQYNLRDNPVNTRDNPVLTTPAFSLDSGLVFDRFFKAGNTNLQQTFEPRLYYLNVEFDEQDDLPSFDATNPAPRYDSLFRRNRYSGYDRYGDTEQVSLGVGNSLLFADTGAELAHFAIGQAFYLKDRQVLFRPNPADNPTRSTSPVFANLRLRLDDRFSLNTTYEFDTDSGDTNQTKVSLRYTPDHERILNVGYTYTNPEAYFVNTINGVSNSEESDVSVIWPIIRKWNAFGRWNFGWDSEQTIESMAGIEYNDCCFRVRFAFRRFLQEPLFVDVTLPDGSTSTFVQPRSESRFLVEVQLKGLGNLNNRLDRLLEFAIPGYRQREDAMGRD